MLLNNNGSRSLWVVVGSFLAAGCLNILPVGWTNGYFQPDWVALVLIYWCLWQPERVGPGVGWLSGLFLDALDYAALGKHMLAKTVLGFLSNKLSLRLRAYPTWQQCIGVGLLVGVDTAVVAVATTLAGQPPLEAPRWLTPVSSMLMWPLVVMVLQRRVAARSYR